MIVKAVEKKDKKEEKSSDKEDNVEEKKKEGTKKKEDKKDKKEIAKKKEAEVSEEIKVPINRSIIHLWAIKFAPSSHLLPPHKYCLYLNQGFIFFKI